MLRGSVSLLAVLAVIGCASVDEELLNTQLPEPPAKWTAADDVADPPVGDWLAPFGDQALYGLVNEAMLHNNTLLAAAANLDAARATAKIEPRQPPPDAERARQRQPQCDRDGSFARGAGGRRIGSSRRRP